METLRKEDAEKDGWNADSEGLVTLPRPALICCGVVVTFRRSQHTFDPGENEYDVPSCRAGAEGNTEGRVGCPLIVVVRERQGARAHATPPPSWASSFTKALGRGQLELAVGSRVFLHPIRRACLRIPLPIFLGTDTFDSVFLQRRVWRA